MSIWLVTIRIPVVKGKINLKNDTIEDLYVGDLVKKKLGPKAGRLAVVVGLALEEYYDFNFWIRIAYADAINDYEWVRRVGIQKLNK